MANIDMIAMLIQSKSLVNTSPIIPKKVRFFLDFGTESVNLSGDALIDLGWWINDELGFKSISTTELEDELSVLPGLNSVGIML